MPNIHEFPFIAGVQLVNLQYHADERGRFTEIFRKEWFPEREWGNVQSNRSESAPGVLRGLHYHHRQVDYWHLVSGAIRAGLVDLRRSSPTYGNARIIEIREEDNLGLYIPVGVAHGFLSLSKVTLIYIVDNYYDGGDEFGVAWNDPDLGLAWGLDNPRISERDAGNPALKDIPSGNLPP